MASLQVAEVFPDDEGAYRCLVKSGGGEAETSADLTIKGRAPITFVKKTVAKALWYLYQLTHNCFAFNGCDLHKLSQGHDLKIKNLAITGYSRDFSQGYMIRNNFGYLTLNLIL